MNQIRGISCLNLGPYVDLCNNKALLECAGKVVRRCRGLPLALIAIGKAFGCYGNSILEWDSGLESLMKSPTDIPGIEGELLTLLKFSFDRLHDKELQLCLLYCSLYPYDFNISTSFIIQQWVGEGILQNAKGYREEYVSLRRRGLLVISKLKSACLLESSELGDRFVKMHDSVRDMCLWITKGYISNLLYENFLVYNTCEYSSQLELEEWATLTKISFIGSRITHIGSQNTGRQQNPRLMTMLLNNCHSLFRIHDDFFQLMPSLRVLDLTGVKLKELPKSIVCLVELRFLNLKSTRIERLPKEFGNLGNLRQLYLENTLHLRYIPKEALSNLSRLQCLCVLRSSFQWGLEIEDDHGSTIQVRDLQKLKMLDEIGIDVKSVIAFGELLKYFSTRAMSRLTALRFLGDEFTQEHVSSAYLSFLRMRRFWISDCNNVKELIFSKGYDSSLEWLSLNNVANLKSISVIIDEVEYEEGNEIFDAHVMPIPRSHCFPVARLLTIYIQGSNYLQDLSCVLNIPTLETVKLSNCKALREILSAFSSHQMTTATKKNPFPRLQYIELENLPSFKRISSTEPLSFPSLRFLCVSHCPELKKHPFDLEIAKSIKRMRGSREWWKNLQWDVDETECALRAHFQATHS